MRTIDLNCDIGEGFGVYRYGCDEEMIKLATSVNIACGFHAGDAGIMRDTVRQSMDNGVAVGAHPGLPDRDGFGRRSMAITAREAYDMTVYQIGALRAFAHSEGGAMSHVKPHGALYHMAATSGAIAEAIAEAVYKVDGSARLVGMSGGELIRAGERLGLVAVSEVFADRTYEQDGSLTPRGFEGAVLASSAAAAEQAKQMIRSGTVRTRQGTLLAIQAETICIHGDTPGAAAHAVALRRALADIGIQFAAPAARRDIFRETNGYSRQGDERG